MDDNATRERVEKHASIAEQLQDLVLEDFLKMLKDGELTSTDRKTLVDLLRANGWSFNPQELPTTLLDKLTKQVKFDEDLENENRLKVM